ncbi:hypothetical protein [Gorillibacterium massiliense]|uniref:hypothetical protein n=1 Tax=Gorillibacterium massiliense TaxID=1280390 RepID=UPI001EE232F7|nr:hypothetical protein [Gorillibacterium massiliense]
MESMRIRDSKLWIEDFLQYERQKEDELSRRRKAAEQEAEEAGIRNLEELKRAEAKNRRIQQYEARKNRPLNESYKEVMQDRLSFQQRFTDEEKKLFHKLCLKHGFTVENFPGILQLNLQLSDLIVTPPQLWQLWVFNEIAGQYKYCVWKKKEPRIWLDNTKKRFMDIRKNGILRIKRTTNEEGNYIFTLYNYISKLNDGGILQKLGSWTKKYHSILVNRLPTFPSHKENVLLNMNFDGLSHPSIEDVYMQYRSKIYEIHADCQKQQSTSIRSGSGRVEVPL